MSVSKESKSLEGREAIDIQKSGYADDVCLVEAKLRLILMFDLSFNCYGGWIIPLG